MDSSVLIDLQTCLAQVLLPLAFASSVLLIAMLFMAIGAAFVLNTIFD